MVTFDVRVKSRAEMPREKLKLGKDNLDDCCRRVRESIKAAITTSVSEIIDEDEEMIIIVKRRKANAAEWSDGKSNRGALPVASSYFHAVLSSQCPLYCSAA